MYNKITNSEKRFSNHHPHKKEQNYERRRAYPYPAAHAADAVVLLEKSDPTTHFPPSSAIVSMRAITSSRTAVL